MTKREKEISQALFRMINKVKRSEHLSEYEFGIANGLIIAKAILEGKKPKPIFPEINDGTLIIKRKPALLDS